MNLQNPSDNTVVKRLNITELRPNMVIANDVFDRNGAVLMSADTVVSKSGFNLLKQNDIAFVFVRETSINMQEQSFAPYVPQVESIPVVERKEFQAFEKNYIEKNEDIKKTLLAISDGSQIDVTQLYDLTDGILSQMKFMGDVFTYLNFLKARDEHTFSHSNNVALLANVFGSWLGLDKSQLVTLTTAAMLHDLGKTKIPDEILNKKGKLTVEEFQEIKKHPLYGYRLMEKQDNIPNEAKLVALMHHEKIDGSGYPMGITGEKIIPYAKIVAICDIYDAMTANRIYRNKICPFEVIKNFEQRSFGELDTKHLLVFLQNIAYNYVGCQVTLTDGRIGDVVFINRMNLSRPIVRCGGEIVDLNTAKHLEIASVN